MNRRRGTSLIELLVIIATSVMIVGLVAGMIDTLVRANRTAEDHLVRSMTVRQLCDTVRRRVRAAAEAHCEEQGDSSRLQLQMEGGDRTEFAAFGQQVTRIDYEDGQARRREVYILPGQSRARFEVRAGSTGRAVILAIAHRKDLTADGQIRELHIETVLGRDLRFVSRRE